MLPEKFKERAKAILGEEYDDFIGALQSGEAVKGLRINLIKATESSLSQALATRLTPLGYTDNGYLLSGEERIGQSPEHHAGMVYAQDPGAMATVCALDIEPDWYVADLCAAPGGKSSQIAERLSERGFLLSNEYVPKRAKIVVTNFERLGVRGAMVTSMDTSELSKMYRAYFDLVVADAPCSGEGMFRKSEESIAEWSEENVLACAKRQAEILENAHSMVKGGGYLLYSTCTYSLEENEMAADAFLRAHPDFHLCEVKESLRCVTADGITFEGAVCRELYKTRRFYPHRTPGEGQFIALMQRDEKDLEPAVLYRDSAKPLSRTEEAAVLDFMKESLVEIPAGRLAKVRENPVIISHGCPVPANSVFMSGTLLGQINGKTFKPSHQLFSVYGELFRRKISLDEGDPRLGQYLSGEEIDAGTDECGWCAVTYRGAPLGGGKLSGGKCKNHYPKGLRRQG